MAGDINILQDFLVNVGFRIDQATLNQFNTTISQTNNTLNAFGNTINNVTIRMGQGLTRGGSPFARQMASFLSSTAGISGIPGMSGLVGAAAEGGILGATAMGFLGIAATAALAGRAMINTVSHFSQLGYAARSMQASVTDLLALNFAARQMGMNPGDVQGAFTSMAHEAMRYPGPTASLWRAIGAPRTTETQLRTEGGTLTAFEEAARNWRKMHQQGKTFQAESYAKSAGVSEDMFFKLVTAKDNDAFEKELEKAKKIWGDKSSLADSSMKLAQQWNELTEKLKAFEADVLVGPITWMNVHFKEFQKTVDDLITSLKYLYTLIHPENPQVSPDEGAEALKNTGKRILSIDQWILSWILPSWLNPDNYPLEGGDNAKKPGPKKFANLGGGKSAYDPTATFSEDEQSLNIEDRRSRSNQNLREAIKDLTDAIKDLTTGDSSFALVRDCLKKFCSAAGTSALSFLGSGSPGGSTPSSPSSPTTPSTPLNTGGMVGEFLRKHLPSSITKHLPPALGGPPTGGEGGDVSGAGSFKQLVDREAREAGVDPRILYGILAGESGGNYWSHRFALNPKDPSGGAFGPWQMVGGGRMGTDFEKATGKSFRDPKNIPEMTRFAIRRVAWMLKTGKNIHDVWHGYSGPKNWDPRWGNFGYQGGETPQDEAPTSTPQAPTRLSDPKKPWLRWPKDWGHPTEGDPRKKAEAKKADEPFDPTSIGQWPEHWFPDQHAKPVGSFVNQKVYDEFEKQKAKHRLQRWKHFDPSSNWLHDRMQKHRSFSPGIGSDNVSMNNTYHIHIAGYSNPHEAGMQVASHIDHTNRTSVRNFKTRVA